MDNNFEENDLLEEEIIPVVGEKLIKRRRSFTMAFKSQAIAMAKSTNISNAARHFNVDRQTVQKWMGSSSKILNTQKISGRKMRATGGGRRPASLEMKIVLLK